MKRSTKTSLGRHDLAMNRLFRDVVEIANGLDKSISSANSLKHIFSDAIISSRQRLKDECESILYSAPLEFGRKAEEILWRRCYHDVMQYYKRNKKRMPSEDIVLLQIHLTTGFGHYYNLLLGISKHYGIGLKKLMPYITPVANIDDFANSRESHKHEVMSWAQLTIHRILIYMGDLARYLYDLEVNGYRELSIRFYDAALIWNPDVGMPFNQLGTLSESNNYGLDSVYYYMRCLTCDKPFDGAENNLRRVFDNNDKYLNEFQNEKSGEESYKIIKRAILQFLKLCNEYWFIKPSDNQFNKNVLPLLQEVLYSFKAAFNLKPKLTTDQMPTYLTSMATFEVAVITSMIVSRIQDMEEFPTSLLESPTISSIVTFSINFMMSVILSCHQNLRNKLSLDSFKSNGVSNLSQGMTKESTPELSPRRVLSRLRRRKAAINYDDKNALSLDDDDSELSELEETALSTIDALEIGSDLSDSNDESDSDNRDITIISSDEDNSLRNRTIEVTTLETSLLPAEELLHYILDDSYLPTIKMYCDWLRSNPNLLALSSSQLQIYFEEFINFANTLISIEEKVLVTFPNLYEFKCFGANWSQKYPLASDLSLSNIKCLKSSFDDISFDSQRILNKVEKGFLCIESIVAFSHFLADMKSPNVYGIAYNSNEKRFSFHCYSNGTQLTFYDTNTWSDTNSIFLSTNTQSINDIEHENSVNENTVDESKRQKKFMRNMAHLWLKAEVNQLEKDVSYSPQLPPYMVLDSSTYCEDLSFIKELASSKRFILVVPRIVLAALDHLKKTSVNAREAIRWLEEELQRGNRVIKYPKDLEKLSLSPIKYPKRKDKEACDYYELLEYCNYLNNNTKAGDRKSVHGIPMVTLLTHSFNKWPANAEAIAKTSDIHIETVDSFLSKWQNSVKAIT